MGLHAQCFAFCSNGNRRIVYFCGHAAMHLFKGPRPCSEHWRGPEVDPRLDKRQLANCCGRVPVLIQNTEGSRKGMIAKPRKAIVSGWRESWRSFRFGTPPMFEQVHMCSTTPYRKIYSEDHAPKRGPVAETPLRHNSYFAFFATTLRPLREPAFSSLFEHSARRIFR